ncbi:unnamed protein product [Linum tenue]|uniref:Uncharacterized protein n=1 Tax=Linum tenue TaxID=586396 RepID=A0AAV0NJ00_9ROSI|nr:unnamed protein product [Linum tenue]
MRGFPTITWDYTLFLIYPTINCQVKSQIVWET